MSNIVWIFFRIYLIIQPMELCNASGPSQFTNLYVNMGDDLILPCTVNNYTTAFWQGPCFRTADCTILNITTYFDGLMRYQEVPTSITVAINRSERGNIYDLHISNVSMKSAGQFVCNEFKGVGLKETKFNVILKVKPTNLCIKNTLDGRITGTAGTPLNLVCRVTSGVPLENMTWYQNQTVVHEGGPGVIKYLFTPSTENNGQKFSCVVQSDALETAMKETIILDINYRPVVQCFEESISVMEGNRFTVQCSVDSNPPPTKITIHRNNVILHRCTQPPCNLILLGSRHDSGVYICTAQNQIGDGNNCQTVVKILYPPVVSVLILNVTTLRCTGTGEPNNVSYLSWTHYSEKGKVTNFNGSKYLELCSSCKRYMVNGLYRCSATNGIQHTDGSNISFGNVSVQLKGSPEILPDTKRVQYGKYKNPVSLEIFVYSTTMITIERILRNGEVLENSRKLATNGGFQNEHKATHDIAVLHEVDFTNYTFELKNDQGATQFTVSLEAKDIPETPDIKQLTVKDSSIMVKFSDNFDGGLSQVFVLQYRYILNWTNVEINDTFDGIGSYTFHNLEVGQKYYFRIYSVNTVGKSNVSEVWSIELPGAPSPQLFQYILIATGIVVIMVITTLISKKVEAMKTCLGRRNNNEENDSVHEQQGQNLDALVENQLYLAFDSLPRNPHQNASGTGPRHVAAQNHGENSMQGRNLHYAELEFNPASHQFVIRGDDRTIYSEIDHSLVAPPLESSDSEEDDKKNEDEDDFMSVEEVAELMRGKGMRPALND